MRRTITFTLLLLVLLAPSPSSARLWRSYRAEAMHSAPALPLPDHFGRAAARALRQREAIRTRARARWERRQHRLREARLEDAYNAPEPTATPSPSTTSTNSGGSFWNMDTVACESGGDPWALSPTGKYKGLLQFSLDTWHAFGGAGSPLGQSLEATAAVADRVTYDAWPGCPP